MAWLTKAYLHEERGAVSADWVALAAGLLLLSAATVYGVFAGTTATLVERIEGTAPAFSGRGSGEGPGEGATSAHGLTGGEGSTFPEFSGGNGRRAVPE